MDGDSIALLYLLTALSALVVLVICACAAAWATRDRWMGRSGRRAVAAGAFRSAVVTTDRERQHRRWLVLATAILSLGWAILTFFFFAPAGAIGGLFLGLVELGTGQDDRFFWLSLGAASLSALPLTIAIVVSALLLVQRSEEAPRIGAGTAIYSAVHHGALVLLGLGYAVLAPGPSLDGLAEFTAAAAAPGLLLAAMMATSALLARRDV